jgi:hypothetical protein
MHITAHASEHSADVRSHVASSDDNRRRPTKHGDISRFPLASPLILRQIE